MNRKRQDDDDDNFLKRFLRHSLNNGNLPWLGKNRVSSSAETMPSMVGPTAALNDSDATHKNAFYILLSVSMWNLFLHVSRRFSCSRHFAGSNWRGKFKGASDCCKKKCRRSKCATSFYLKTNSDKYFVIHERKLSERKIFSFELNQLLHNALQL